MSEIEAKAKTVEQVAATEVAKVEGEVKTVAEAVVAEVKKDLISLESEDKFILRDVELEYLKITMEIQRLQKITEEKAKTYQAKVDALFVKYGVDKAEYFFDAAKLLITKTKV